MRNKVKIPAVFALLVILGAVCFQSGITYAQSSTTIYPSFFTDPDVDSLTAGSVNSTQWYSGSANVTDVLNYPESEASYIIFTDGTTVYAKNGMTGSIDYKGTNATAVIQSTLDATESSGGGTVYLHAGKYLLDSRVLAKTGVNICGSGYSTVFELTVDVDAMIQISSGVSNLRIAGIRFEQPTSYGFTTTYYIYSIPELPFSEKFTIENCWFIGHTFSGAVMPQNMSDVTVNKQIEIGASRDFVIQNNVFNTTTHEGISLGSTLWDKEIYPTGARILSNQFSYCKHGGIVLEYGFSDCVVANNVIDQCGPESSDFGIALFFGNTQSNVIDGNIIMSCGGYSIYLSTNEAAPGSGSYSIISNNMIDNRNTSATYGILDNGAANMITGNTVIGGVMGIRGGRVDGNTVIATTETGIVAGANSKITGNTILNCALEAIRVTGACAVIEGNTITGGMSVPIRCYSSGINAIVQNNYVVGYVPVSATLADDYPAGTTVIAVNDSRLFTTGQYIITSPTGYDAENHRIKDIDSRWNLITLYSPLTNDHTSGDAVASRNAMLNMFELLSGGNVSVFKDNVVYNLKYGALAAIPTYYSGNIGFTTEATGSLGNAINASSFLHGLAGTPTSITLTCNISGILVNPIGINSTGVQLGLIWYNGTAVDADHSPTTVYYSVTYKP